MANEARAWRASLAKAVSSPRAMPQKEALGFSVGGGRLLTASLFSGTQCRLSHKPLVTAAVSARGARLVILATLLAVKEEGPLQSQRTKAAQTQAEQKDLFTVSNQENKGV